MDWPVVFKQFQDHLAPKMDAYEQAIYLYIFRHSRLEGQEEVVIGFKSARTRMACGIGEKGSPMSESTAAVKIQCLHEKGFIKVVSSERSGRRIKLFLPSEIPGVIPEENEVPEASIEEMDFFNVPANRLALLRREQHKCFYCLCSLNAENWLVEHVVSRPNGDNSYRNLVASCRRCNNRKDSRAAEDYLRTLYREGFLSSEEFEDRLSHLEALKNGQLRPEISG